MFDIVPAICFHTTGTITIGINQMKKPFKVGAVYKLKKSMMQNYMFTSLTTELCTQYYGKPNAPFQMKVVECVSSGSGFNCVMLLDGNQHQFYVCGRERSCFKRVKQ